jgi:hypothetical protein
MVLIRIAEEVDMIIAVDFELTFPNKEIVTVLDVKTYLAQIRRCADSNSLRLVYKGIALSDDVDVRKWVEEHPIARTRPYLSLWESDNGLFAGAASPPAIDIQRKSPSSVEFYSRAMSASPNRRLSPVSQQPGLEASSSASSVFTPASSSSSPRSSASTPAAYARLAGRLDERSLVAAANWLQRTLVPVAIGGDTTTSPAARELAALRSSSASASYSSSSNTPASASSSSSAAAAAAAAAAADAFNAQQAQCRRVARSLRHLVRSKNSAATATRARSSASPTSGSRSSYPASPLDADEALEREQQLRELRGRRRDGDFDFDFDIDLGGGDGGGAGIPAELQQLLQGLRAGAFVHAGAGGADALRGMAPPRQLPAPAAAEEPVALAVHMRMLVRFILAYWLFGQDASPWQLALMLGAGIIYYLYETHLLLRVGKWIARLFGVHVEVAGQGEQLLLVDGMILRGRDVHLFLQGHEGNNLAQRRGNGAGLGAGAGADARGRQAPAVEATAAAAAAAQPAPPREPTTPIERLVAYFKELHREGYPVPQTPGVLLDLFSLCYSFVASLAPTWDPRPVTPIRLAPPPENAARPEAGPAAEAEAQAPVLERA